MERPDNSRGTGVPEDFRACSLAFLCARIVHIPGHLPRNSHPVETLPGALQEPGPGLRRSLVGDKGGKKDKNKSQKQAAQQRDQKAREKRDKQPKSAS